MSVAPAVVKTSPLEEALKAITDFRIIPPLEISPSVVSFAQTVWGKISLLVAFGLGLGFFFRDVVLVTCFITFLAIVTLFPGRRRLVLAIAPIAFVIKQNFGNPVSLGVTFAVIAVGISLYWFARRWPNSVFGQRPVLFLILGFALLIGFACYDAQSSVLWTAVGVVASYVWFFAYALADHGSTPSRDSTLELTAFRPLWGQGVYPTLNTPFPKGAAYLRRIEAKNPEQLAVTQLKGLKLLSWAILLAIFSGVWNFVIHDTLAIPPLGHALAMNVQGTPIAWHLRWLSLIVDFLESILSISVTGHLVVAICRMAGFNALRNTYRPLSSTTVSDFFNRYYYYYKELLVEFFFYPVFFRYWKRRPRMRLAFATFSAAFLGNSLYHFTRDWLLMQMCGFRQALWRYDSFFFYSAILATLLIVSQLRKRAPRSKGLVRGRIIPIGSVWLLFCLLDVFIINDVDYSLAEHLKYLASLFFVHF